MAACAPLLTVCACEKDLFRPVTALSTVPFITAFHCERVQVFTVRRRRKEGEREKMKTNVSGLNVWTADGEGGQGRRDKVRERE